MTDEEIKSAFDLLDDWTFNPFDFIRPIEQGQSLLEQVEETARWGGAVVLAQLIENRKMKIYWGFMGEDQPTVCSGRWECDAEMEVFQTESLKSLLIKAIKDEQEFNNRPIVDIVTDLKKVIDEVEKEVSSDD